MKCRLMLPQLPVLPCRKRGIRGNMLEARLPHKSGIWYTIEKLRWPIWLLLVANMAAASGQNGCCWWPKWLLVKLEAFFVVAKLGAFFFCAGETGALLVLAKLKF
jgi:hypothetical protein